MIIAQRRFRFDPMWALAAIAIGIIFTLAVNVGAGQGISIEFLGSGAFMGLCIYFANMLLHYFLTPFVGRCSVSLAPGLRIGISILGGMVGWGFAYLVLIFAETGHFGLPLFTGRMEWFLMITLAITVGIALLAGGYNELRDHLKESIKAEQELDVARSIQSRLLPPPRIEGKGYVITARNVPAQFVAGDFYDVLHLEDGSVGIVVADVSEKGIGASLIMASVKAILPYVATASVEQTLGALNDRLVEQLDRREFVALTYARFEPPTGKLQLGNAGMPDPYLISSGVRAISVGGERLPLGVRRDVRYGSVELQLQPGDRLLLLSDGIPEAPRPNGEQMGYEALLATVAKVSGNAWLDNLFDRVRAQVTGVDDDWTAVLLELGS